MEVLARASGLAATSGAAAAIWFPYHVEAPGREAQLAALARESWTWLARCHAECPAAGVVDLPRLAIASDGGPDAPPAWAPSLPPEAGLSWVEGGDLPGCVRGAGVPVPRGAWSYRAPLVDPVAHLAWLAAGLARPVRRVEVEDLSALAGDFVVHASGHCAGALTPDPALTPSYGQTWTVELEGAEDGLCVIDARDEERLFHALSLPGGAVVVGGFDVPWTGDGAVPAAADPDEARRAELERRCAERGLTPRGAGLSRAGWRPVRSGGPRIEREGRVLHAYGHGGAGFTLAWGTAGRVVELARDPGGISRAGC